MGAGAGLYVYNKHRLAAYNPTFVLRFAFHGFRPTLWTATRLYTGCTEVNLTTASPLHPPLSAAELAYQCNGSAARPCKLLWYPGQRCYTINATATFGPRIPGYHARASALGYRMVAGPSGTTADVMQYAELLGFGTATSTPSSSVSHT